MPPAPSAMGPAFYTLLSDDAGSCHITGIAAKLYPHIDKDHIVLGDHPARVLVTTEIIRADTGGRRHRRALGPDSEHRRRILDNYVAAGHPRTYRGKSRLERL